VAKYIQAAMEFAAWAYMSDEARADAAAASRAVETSLAATKRVTAMCDYSLSGGTPHTAQHSVSPALRAGSEPVARLALLPPPPCTTRPGSGSRAGSRLSQRAGDGGFASEWGSPSLQPSESSSPLLRAASRATSHGGTRMGEWVAASPACGAASASCDDALAQQMNRSLSLARHGVPRTAVPACASQRAWQPMDSSAAQAAGMRIPADPAPGAPRCCPDVVMMSHNVLVVPRAMWRPCCMLASCVSSA
jgi:hypothetical protein